MSEEKRMIGSYEVEHSIHLGVVEAVGSSPVTQTISNPRIYAVCKEL